MAPPAPRDARRFYGTEALCFAGEALSRMVRAPIHSRRAAAGRFWARRSLLLTAAIAALIVVLVVALDAAEIGWMPVRGTAYLWPLRILTDFGKSTYVLWTLFAALCGLALLAPRLSGTARAVLMSFFIRIQFIFSSVLLAVLAGELIKGVVGRGRPFVGGVANPYNFSYFSFSEAYSSFPSGHATTAFALAFAVAALWPRLRLAMIVYVLVIAATRLVLLAHHPSDVVGGALIGVIGAMAMRYWFAARKLGFSIRPDGSIVALEGPNADDLKRVAGQAIAPYEAGAANRH
jgi:undecaprenyl-diphosphatase